MQSGRHLMSPDVLSYCVRCGATEQDINSGAAEWCPAGPDERRGYEKFAARQNILTRDKLPQ